MGGADSPDLQVQGYRIEAWLADGGMASVFAAWQLSLQRRVALKVLRSLEGDLAQRFQREARLLATLSHRHVSTIYDVGRLDDGRPFLAMELLPGGSLRQRLAGAPLREQEVRLWAIALVDALAAVHACGVIHRDIKPGNILFRDDGTPVLCDFGVALEDERGVDVTRTGVMVGSPAYSSPEQAAGRRLDARSDQYSLGVVLLECLLGHNPFRGDDYGSTLMRQLQMPPPRLPPALAPWQSIIDRLLAKEAEERYADLSTLAQAVQQLTVSDTSIVHVASPDVDETVTRQSPLAVSRSEPPAVSTPRRQERRRWRWRYVGLLLVLVSIWPAVQEYRLQRWLHRADARMEAGQLLQPVHDSALFYYRRVLALRPGNDHALAAVARMARGYRDAALLEASRHRWRAAQNDLQQALTVTPDAVDLLALRERLLQEQQVDQAKHGRSAPVAQHSGHHAGQRANWPPHWLRRWIGG